ncbi:MAG TPA: hypothetical protein VGM79_07270, partial [Streptosporangiaceae bacterium]
MREHRAHARFVWNLAVEQHSYQAMKDFFGGTHRRPAFRKAGRADGFRMVAVKPGHVRRLNRRAGEVWVP